MKSALKSRRQLPFVAGLAAVAALAFAAAPALADTVVIVHPATSAVLDDDALARIFLRQVRSFPDGAAAQPVSQKEGPATEDFRTRVLKKNAAQLRAYWAQQVFTGGAKPLQELDSDEAVMKYVAETPGGIGYIDAAKVKPGVRVVKK